MTEIAGQLDLLDLLGGATPAPAEEVQETTTALADQPPPRRPGLGTGLVAAWQRTVACWPDHTPVTWTAPWDCADGTPAGTTLPAVHCPHCGQIEPSEMLLMIDHGVSLGRRETWAPAASAGAMTQCLRQALTASRTAHAGEPVVQCRHCGIRALASTKTLPEHAGPYRCRGNRPGHDWRPVVPPLIPALVPFRRSDVAAALGQTTTYRPEETP